MFACSRRILPSPAEAGFKPPHYRLERNEDNRGLRPRRVMYFLAVKSTDRSLRLVLFAAFWSAVNRGLRPRRVMYFLTAKSTKNSPADAFAYFVPANVRNGRLFAGLQANRPRFLPLLAGPSFRGSGIGPESFAAFRGGRLFPRKRHVDGFGAFNFAALVFLLLTRHSPQAVSARAACVGCHQKYRESRDDVAGVLYLFSAKSTDRSLRLVFFAAFWSAKSGAKTDPPTKKAKRRGLTLAPGDYSRVCKQTVPSARAFSPHLFERLFCQAGVIRREKRHVDGFGAFNFATLVFLLLARA